MIIFATLFAFGAGFLFGVLFGARNVKITKALNEKYKAAVDAAEKAAKDKAGI